MGNNTVVPSDSGNMLPRQGALLPSFLQPFTDMLTCAPPPPPPPPQTHTHTHTLILPEDKLLPSKEGNDAPKASNDDSDEDLDDDSVLVAIQQDSRSIGKILPPTGAAKTLSRMDSMWAVQSSMTGSSSMSVDDAATAADTAADELEASICELVMVSPWPLMARVPFFPRPTTKSQVSPAWHEAPKAAGVTILFTTIPGFSKIQEKEQGSGRGDALAAAVRTLQRVVRAKLLEHGGYEAEGEGVNFVAAFHSPVEAVAFSAAVQAGLLSAPWSSEVLDTSWGCVYCSASGQVTYRGLRLAVGMCTGDAVLALPSERTGRMEYFGPLM